jgi:hypothetical protein
VLELAAIIGEPMSSPGPADPVNQGG